MSIPIGGATSLFGKQKKNEVEKMMILNDDDGGS